MWLTILATYCLASWLIAAILVGVYRQTGAEVAAEKGVALASLEWRIVMVAPLVMPFILWVFALEMIYRTRLHRRQAELRWALKTVREYEFAKVNSLYLAEPVRRLFEQHTPALFQLGFNLIGDFRMKSKPVEVHDRILLSDDGETLATICAVLERGSTALISILSNGICVHTSGAKNPKPERTVEPQDRLCMTWLPGVSIEEQFREHQNVLHEQCAIHGASVIGQHADQFREVLIYDQRIFNRFRFRHGDLPAQPPAPDFSKIQQAELASA